MVRCILRPHRNKYQVAAPRGDVAENMFGSSLEPESRYDSCCSSIFRPGSFLRDLIVGFIVVFDIAVVIAVLLVVCKFFVPAVEQKETGDVLGKGEALSGGPREVEINTYEVDIIEFGHTDGHDHKAELTGDSTKYDVETDKARYDQSEEPETEPEPNSEPEPDSEPEPESVPEPEFEPEPETEPESEYDHDNVTHHHNHGSDDVEHDHSHSDHEHTDHKHEHPNHHLEHPDHDDIIHMHMEEVPADQQPAEQVDNDMDHTDQMDRIEHDQHDGQMDHTGQMDYTGHLDNVDQTEHGEHMPQDDGLHMAKFSHFDNKEMHQPQEDLVMTEEHSEIHHQPEFGGSCRPRSLEMCSDMPYTATMLPNWVNDQNSEDLLNVSLPYFRDIIVRSSCSPRARSFACAVLEPSCVMDPSGRDTILPPCRSFCRSVGTTCAEFIISGLALSEVFDCERFPESTDPSVCFDMSQAPFDDIKVTPETSLPSSFNYIQDPSSINSGIQELNSPDYSEPQHYSDFPPNVNDASFGADLISVATENPTDFVGETSNPGQEAPLGSTDQTSSTTEESEVIVNQQILEEAFESVEPSPAGEVASQPELLEETPEGPLICTLDMFLCWDGSDCLDNSALCDDYPHCIDASDEYNCTAPPNELSGFSQSAVPASEPFETATTIEFVSEPQDLFGFSTFTPLEDLPQPFKQTTEVGFDEPTTFSLFDIVPPSDCELTCLDGTCITVEQLNNGVSDCPDGTDEKNMPK